MADYHSPTVVQPNIPPADITPFERLILDLAFDAESEPDGIYFHSWCGPSGTVTLPAEALRVALEASSDWGQSSIGKHASALLARYDAQVGDDRRDGIDIDLTEADNGWDRMFQNIVRRSATIDEIVVTSAFTCSRMRPDGFGGSVMHITADAIRYCSTADMLEAFWNEAAKASPNPSHSPAVGTS